KLVERTKRQGTTARTGAEAAQARAAAEQVARVEEALAVLPEVVATKARTASKEKKGTRVREARTSTTDPEARIMKMADGGYRPAYNVQFATDQDSDVIVGLAVMTQSAEQHSLPPMLNQ